MDNTEIIKKRSTFVYSQGRRFAVKNATIGSIVFGFLYLVLIYVNTYLIEKVDAPFDTFTIVFTLIATIIITLIAIAFAYFPARYIGGRLANSLEIDARYHVLSERSAIVKGVQFGAVAACMICLPIMCLEFLFILFTTHGEILPGVFLSGEAILIASIAGGWTGKELERLITKLNAA